MDETFEQLRKKGKKSDKEVDSMIKLAREVQAAIKHKKLGPGASLMLSLGCRRSGGRKAGRGGGGPSGS